MNISEKKIHDFQERHAWVEWAATPHKEREGRDNVLPEIVEYINDYPNDFCKPAKSMEGCVYIAAQEVCPTTWVSLSETLIDQFLDNSIGTKYNSILEIPHDDLVGFASGIIGQEVAECFADYIRKHCLVIRKQDMFTIVEKDNEVVLRKYSGNDTVSEVVVPEGVTKIAYAAFLGCKWIKKIVLPNTLSEIDVWGLKDCTGLHFLRIPKAVKFIGNQRMGAKLSVLDFEGGIPRTEKAFEGCYIREFRVNTTRKNTEIPDDINKALGYGRCSYDELGHIVYAAPELCEEKSQASGYIRATQTKNDELVEINTEYIISVEPYEVDCYQRLIGSLITCAVKDTGQSFQIYVYEPCDMVMGKIAESQHN